MGVLQTIHDLPFLEWVRQSDSLFAYAGILLMHTIGMGTVVGVSWIINLRVLGLVPTLAIAPLERFMPLLWAGFWVNAISGVILLGADATHKLVNPDFYVKMVCIALAVVTVRALSAEIFRSPAAAGAPVSIRAKRLAAASTFLWLGAITAGRLLAYLGPGA
jgi:hypothetical protein